ncbi:TPA: MBL fold metallo-hydrolase [Listeria innocua]|uniref:Lin1904 protein n=1 Tax=Listeria innocua serovar 6a (strain ATCC BAA-680 / CLIP 11262) TaxID=272626 RepID=Q92AL8_LISIN|nr:MBL fold metallo-hydrolase [Listeria innocua]ECC1683252.1 MBL fold metallo-hydrolase [Listeria innocua]EDO1167783.1 MBL fold metallo-hydrolase [Listeria innocua]EDO1170594.1 MBL fold metallo-hydrolase [Listeria innocua]EEQ0536101.1 MBL fold metallo-hydrolase [Listeria innocua]EHD9221257.1 MBL fold metallo-hydrolase [Listeria innocua]
MKVTAKHQYWQITTLPHLFPVNCYLVLEKDGLTLIDTGILSHAKGIISLITKLKLPLKRILLTHGHGDHIGGLVALKEAFPEALLMVGSREKLLVETKEIYAFEAQKPLKGSYPDQFPVKIDQLLKDGDMVGSLLIMDTPGHTPGSISFFDERNGHLFVGDLFQTRGGAAICGEKRILFPFPAMGSWDLETSIASAEKLQLVDVTEIACGHGPVKSMSDFDLLRIIQRAKAQLTNKKD